mmetsp:Transcript_46505/g.129633  ORF Transcript_46505/g.129633 Transcript_46505/m.129633 type:complete len:236 (+) Transcript_46505:349-1056(+)
MPSSPRRSRSSSPEARDSFDPRREPLGADAEATTSTTSSSSGSSPKRPEGNSSGALAAFAGVTEGVAASDMSSQLSRISASFWGSSGSFFAASGSGFGACPEASATMEAFTVHMPSRSSTRYRGTHVPFALSPQIAPRAVAHFSHSCQRGSWLRVVLLPMTMQPRRARVSMTFKRRQSDKKPTLPSRLLRTAQKIITSFSWPWKPSTDSTSSPDRNFCRPGRSRISFLIRLTWPL